jgi:HAD superfamily hydrolase (TIGR01509 family)
MADSTAAGALFDVDGTLIDTPYLHTTSWWQALRQFDHDVAMARIHRAIGMGSDKILDHLLGESRDQSQDSALAAAHDSLYAQYWARLRPTPGAADLLRACAKRGMRVVLASSASAKELVVLRAALDCEAAIDAATSSADADESKPAPDILAAALDQGGVSATRAVFIGDSVWDVYAATRLDVPCIGLSCGGTSAAELTEAGAVEVYEHPAALLKVLDHSILTQR